MLTSRWIVVGLSRTPRMDSQTFAAIAGAVVGGLLGVLGTLAS